MGASHSPVPRPRGATAATQQSAPAQPPSAVVAHLQAPPQSAAAARLRLQQRAGQQQQAAEAAAISARQLSWGSQSVLPGLWGPPSGRHHDIQHQKLTSLYVLSQRRHGRLSAHRRQLSACVVVCGCRDGSQVDVRGQRDAAAVDLQRRGVAAVGWQVDLRRWGQSSMPVGQLSCTAIQRGKARQGCQALPASQRQLTCSACRRPASSGGGT